MMEYYEFRGYDPADFPDSTSAERIGARIREIREAKGISQTDLGKAVGLNGDRMQKYEKGFRKPKPELLKQIAKALGVSTFALMDPITANAYGAMFGLFEMEKNFGLKIGRENDKLVLRFKRGVSSSLPRLLSEWEKECRHVSEELIAASTEEEQDAVLFDYQVWKWTFPRSLHVDTKKSLNEIKKERIKEQIDELQKELDYLNDNEDNDE